MLVKKQIDFTMKFSKLLAHAILKGQREGFYAVLEEAYRPPTATYGHKNSTHHHKLAAHILLFDLEYNWLSQKDPELERKIYNELHDYWEFSGGAKRIPGDLNHFSFEHNGVR